MRKIITKAFIFFLSLSWLRALFRDSETHCLSPFLKPRVWLVQLPTEYLGCFPRTFFYDMDRTPDLFLCSFLSPAFENIGQFLNWQFFAWLYPCYWKWWIGKCFQGPGSSEFCSGLSPFCLSFWNLASWSPILVSGLRLEIFPEPFLFDINRLYLMQDCHTPAESKARWCYLALYLLCRSWWYCMFPSHCVFFFGCSLFHIL